MAAVRSGAGDDSETAFGAWLRRYRYRLLVVLLCVLALALWAAIAARGTPVPDSMYPMI